MFGPLKLKKKKQRMREEAGGREELTRIRGRKNDDSLGGREVSSCEARRDRQRGVAFFVSLGYEVCH